LELPAPAARTQPSRPAQAASVACGARIGTRRSRAIPASACNRLGTPLSLSACRDRSLHGRAGSPRRRALNLFPKDSNRLRRNPHLDASLHVELKDELEPVVDRTPPSHPELGVHMSTRVRLGDVERTGGSVGKLQRAVLVGADLQRAPV